MKYFLILSILLIPFASKSQTKQDNDSIWGTFVNQVDTNSTLYFELIYPHNHLKAINDTLKNLEGDSIQIRPYTKKEIQVLYLRNGQFIRRDTLKFKLNEYEIVRKQTNLWGIPPLFWGLTGVKYTFFKTNEGLITKFKTWSNAYWIVLPFERDRYGTKKKAIYYGK